MRGLCTGASTKRRLGIDCAWEQGDVCLEQSEHRLSTCRSLTFILLRLHKDCGKICDCRDFDGNHVSWVAKVSAGLLVHGTGTYNAGMIQSLRAAFREHYLAYACCLNARTALLGMHGHLVLYACTHAHHMRLQLESISVV
jgi:hypothetical protein